MPNRSKQPRRRRRKRRTPKQPKSHNDIGSQLGARVGSAIGNWAQGGLRSLFGSGDYETENNGGAAGGFSVTDNSIVKPLSAANVPLLNSPNVSEEGMMRVKHREFLGDLRSGDNENANTYEYFINPQNPALFPWLSTIAGNFEQWVPHGIVFEFVSTCGNAVSSTNASLGSVSVATQYNVRSGPFSTKSELLNHYFAVSGKTADNLMHAIECNPDEVQIPIFNTLATATIDPTVGEDRLYYLGVTTVRNQGSQSTGVGDLRYTVGELWVTYDISLLKPRINVPSLPPFSTQTLDDRIRYLYKYQTAQLTPEMELEIEAEREEKKEEADALRRLVEEEKLEAQGLYRPSLPRSSSPTPSDQSIHSTRAGRWLTVNAHTAIRGV